MQREIAKEKIYVSKTSVKIWYINVENIVISKLIETKTNIKYLIRYLDKTIRPLVLIMPRISGYGNAFEVKYRDKYKNNKLMYFCIYDEELLEKYKAIWTKMEDIKNIIL